MQLVGVLAPGTPTAVRLTIAHGQDPRMQLWRRGWILKHLLSTHIDDGQLVVTAVIYPKKKNSTPPKVRSHPIHRDARPRLGERPIPYQRIAAYAIVHSSRGLLGTQCSHLTAIPGRWQLPGGGLEDGESPSKAVIREVHEETGQHIVLEKLLDIQSDRWIGRSPQGRLEDFQALRLFYLASCPHPSTPVVLDRGGTTSSARWIDICSWRSYPWTSGTRIILENYLHM